MLERFRCAISPTTCRVEGVRMRSALRRNTHGKNHPFYRGLHIMSKCPTCPVIMIRCASNSGFSKTTQIIRLFLYDFFFNIKTFEKNK